MCMTPPIGQHCSHTSTAVKPCAPTAINLVTCLTRACGYSLLSSCDLQVPTTHFCWSCTSRPAVQHLKQWQQPHQLMSGACDLRTWVRGLQQPGHICRWVDMGCMRGIHREADMHEGLRVVAVGWTLLHRPKSNECDWDNITLCSADVHPSAYLVEPTPTSERNPSTMHTCPMLLHGMWAVALQNPHNGATTTRQLVATSALNPAPCIVFCVAQCRAARTPKCGTRQTSHQQTTSGGSAAVASASTGVVASWCRGCGAATQSSRWVCLWCVLGLQLGKCKQCMWWRQGGAGIICGVWC
jgi:hypothetical protein